MANGNENDRDRAEQDQEGEKQNIRPGGYYQDPNRSKSGRDAEFGGNQGMGTYAQSGNYDRQLKNGAEEPSRYHQGGHNQGDAESGSQAQSSDTKPIGGEGHQRAGSNNPTGTETSSTGTALSDSKQ